MFIYSELQKAYDFYNESLFEKKLPLCVLGIENRKNCKGYFQSSKFDNKGSVKHYICLNTEYWELFSVEKRLSTLVHEMCHLYIKEFGKKCCPGYHNKEWASLMLSFGLIPTDTGKKGGKTTGYNLTQIIDPDGLFNKKTKELFSKGFSLEWKEVKKCSDAEKDERPRKNSGRRLKYSCGCSNIWGGRNLNIICGKCNKKFVEVKND